MTTVNLSRRTVDIFARAACIALVFVALSLAASMPAKAYGAVTSNKLPGFVKIYPGAQVTSVKYNPPVIDVHYTTPAPVSAVAMFYKKAGEVVQAPLIHDTGTSDEYRLLMFARKHPHLTIVVVASHLDGGDTNVSLMYESIK